MPDIPSVGLNQFDVFDPNDINIEAQAYPRPLQPPQALPLGLDIDVELLGYPLALNPAQGLPVPSEVDVGRQNFPGPLSLGVATPTKADIDLMLQIIAQQPIRSFLVTDSGNFDLDNNDNDADEAFTITLIRDAQTGGAVTASTTVYRATLSPQPISFGLPFAGRDLLVTTSVTAGNVGQSRFITFQNGNTISFPRTEGDQNFATNLAAGAVVTIDMKRDGFSVFYDLLPAPLEVFVLADTEPAEVEEPNVDFENFVGDFYPANDAPPVFEEVEAEVTGPVLDFFPDDTSPAIGGGTPIPLLLFENLRETAFFPASQTSVVGLPVNVNVG
jgi:hypothetical protein